MCEYRAVHGRYDWPWRGGPTFLTPDGSQVTLARAGLDGTTLDTSRPWSCGFFALIRGSRRAFTVAEAGAFDWHSTYTTIPDQLHRLPYRGGELVIGVRTQPPEGGPADYRAAWRGQWFELHTRSCGRPDGITSVFDALRLTDTPLGMLVRPRSSTSARLEPLRVAKQIPRLGYLTIERPGASEIELPTVPGYPTRHGQLWRQPLGPGAQGRARADALVLATPTAMTRLIPGPDDSSDPDDALTFLDGLSVTWEAA